MRTIKKELLTFFVIAIIAIPLAAQTAFDSLYLKNPHYQKRIASFEESAADSVSILFFGNSLTFGGEWNTLLERSDIANQGIVSDNTAGMLRRLRFVYRLHPRICFVMAGINDIYADVPVETVFKNYIAIIDTLRSKQIIPIVQSTLYVNPKWKRSEQKNSEVKKLNVLLSAYCAEHSLSFVDLNALLSTNGILANEFTTDGVHLTSAAYRVWSRMIAPIIQSHGL